MSEVIYKFPAVKIPYITEDAALTAAQKAVCEFDIYIGTSTSTTLINWNTASIITDSTLDIFIELSTLREGFELSEGYTLDDIDLTLKGANVLSAFFLEELLFKSTIKRAEVRIVFKQKKTDGTTHEAEPIFMGVIDLQNYTCKHLVETTNFYFDLMKEYKVKCLSFLHDLKLASIDELKTMLISTYSYVNTNYMRYPNINYRTYFNWNNYQLSDGINFTSWKSQKISDLIYCIIKLLYGHTPTINYDDNFAYSDMTNGELGVETSVFSQLYFFLCDSSDNYEGFLFDSEKRGVASFYNFANVSELLKNILDTFQVFIVPEFSYSTYEYNFTLTLNIKSIKAGSAVTINNISSVELKKNSSNDNVKFTNYGISEVGGGNNAIDVIFSNVNAGNYNNTNPLDPYFYDYGQAGSTTDVSVGYYPELGRYWKKCLHNASSFITGVFFEDGRSHSTLSNWEYDTGIGNEFNTFNSGLNCRALITALHKNYLATFSGSKEIIEIEYIALTGTTNAIDYKFTYIKPLNTISYNGNTYIITSIERDFLNIKTKISAVRYL